jgi:signal transduction histidine kinase
LLQV